MTIDAAAVAPLQLLHNLREHLRAASIVRRPGEADHFGYPMWLDPRNGVPAPGQGDNAIEIDDDCVLGAFQVMGFPRAPYDAQWLRTDSVDIWVRTAKAPIAYELDDQIRDVLSDRRAFTLGTMDIIEARLYRPMQRLTSDANGFTFTMQYSFERTNIS